MIYSTILNQLTKWKLRPNNLYNFSLDRYYLKLVVQNLQAFELLIDKISLSPYCFGLGQGVNETMIGNWKPNMSDEAFCELYGKLNPLTIDLNRNLYFFYFKDRQWFISYCFHLINRSFGLLCVQTKNT